MQTSPDQAFTDFLEGTECQGERLSFDAALADTQTGEIATCLHGQLLFVEREGGLYNISYPGSESFVLEDASCEACMSYLLSMGADAQKPYWVGNHCPSYL